MTSNQTDEVIKIAAKLVDSVPMIITMLMSFLGLLTSLFLAIRQHLNKKDTDGKLIENTAVTKEVKEEAKAAYTEANNVNLKLASLGIQTKPELGATAENPVHTITP